MSSTYVIPFNHQPVSFSIKKGSYTVPDGKYARISITDDSYDSVNGLSYSITNNSQNIFLTPSNIGLEVNGIPVHFFSFFIELTVSTTTQDVERVLSVFLPNNYVDFSGSQSFSVISNAGFGASNGVYINKFEASEGPFLGGSSFSTGRLSSVSLKVTKINASGTSTLRSVISNFRKNITPTPSFWVNQGTVINCPVFGKYLVEEYNYIS